MDCADLSHLCETTRFSSDMSISGRVVACRWHDLLRELHSLFFRMDCLADAHSPLLLMWIKRFPVSGLFKRGYLALVIRLTRQIVSLKKRRLTTRFGPLYRRSARLLNRLDGSRIVRAFPPFLILCIDCTDVVDRLAARLFVLLLLIKCGLR